MYQFYLLLFNKDTILSTFELYKVYNKTLYEKIIKNFENIRLLSTNPTNYPKNEKYDVVKMYVNYKKTIIDYMKSTEKNIQIQKLQFVEKNWYDVNTQKKDYYEYFDNYIKQNNINNYELFYIFGSSLCYDDNKKMLPSVDLKKYIQSKQTIENYGDEKKINEIKEMYDDKIFILGPSGSTRRNKFLLKKIQNQGDSDMEILLFLFL